MLQPDPVEFLRAQIPAQARARSFSPPESPGEARQSERTDGAGSFFPVEPRAALVPRSALGWFVAGPLALMIGPGLNHTQSEDVSLEFVESCIFEETF